MLFNVINYSGEIIGQVEAVNSVEAWEEAGKKYENILDVREVTIEEEGLQIKWIRAHGKEARYQFIESFLGWKIFRLASGDTQYFDRYYAESSRLGEHPKAENTKSEIQESIRISELSHDKRISEPPYGERLREWVSLYGGYIEYHPEIEGYKIKKSPEDITKLYMFANSQTRKQDVRIYLVGE